MVFCFILEWLQSSPDLYFILSKSEGTQPFWRDHGMKTRITIINTATTSAYNAELKSCVSLETRGMSVENGKHINMMWCEPMEKTHTNAVPQRWTGKKKTKQKTGRRVMKVAERLTTGIWWRRHRKGEGKKILREVTLVHKIRQKEEPCIQTNR